LSRHLREIPADLPLGDPQALEHVMDGSPADRAWQLLEQEAGAGYVTAGKLLARKRPHLVPVYDSVTRCALGEPERFWLSLQTVLSNSDTCLRRRLVELRSSCRVPAEVGELRVLDVVVWKGHRDYHSRAGCSAPGATAVAN
jgi:hypothetical protein